MWNSIILLILDYLPLFLSLISVVIHFFVFHRLKCTKDIKTCLSECRPFDYIKLLDQVSDLEKKYSEMLSILSEVSNYGTKCCN